MAQAKITIADRKAGKGKCSIDSALIEPYETARASGTIIADAAFALIERCAPRSGGIAVHIGQYDSRENTHRMR